MRENDVTGIKAVKNTLDSMKSMENVLDSDSPGILMWQISTLWRRHVSSALREVDLSHPEYIILKTIALFNDNDEELSQRKLSMTSKLDVNVVSRLVRRLIDVGYIVRCHKENNEKTYFLSLTDEGAKILDKANPIAAKADKEFFAQLSSDQFVNFQNSAN